MQFVLNTKFEILPKASTKTKFIDANPYLEPFKDDKTKRNLTAFFTNTNFILFILTKNSIKLSLKVIK